MKKAFTLAEVLITLTILGVIAVVAIPNLISNYKKIYTITRLKQAYSIIVNATDIAEIYSQKSVNDWNFDNLSDINNYLIPQFSVKRKCSDNNPCIGTIAKDLVGKNVNNMSGTALNLNEKSPNYTYFYVGNNQYTNHYYVNSNAYILSNGMSIGFRQAETTYHYVTMFIDIDGPHKGANQLNKDIFTLFYTKSRPTTKDKNPRFHRYTWEWYIDHVDLEESKCACLGQCTIAKTRGYRKQDIFSSCFSYIVTSGWKIPHDYPEKF